MYKLPLFLSAAAVGLLQLVAVPVSFAHDKVTGQMCSLMIKCKDKDIKGEWFLTDDKIKYNGLIIAVPSEGFGLPKDNQNGTGGPWGTLTAGIAVCVELSNDEEIKSAAEEYCKQRKQTLHQFVPVQTYVRPNIRLPERLDLLDSDRPSFPIKIGPRIIEERDPPKVEEQPNPAPNDKDDLAPEPNEMDEADEIDAAVADLDAAQTTELVIYPIALVADDVINTVTYPADEYITVEVGGEASEQAAPDPGVSPSFAVLPHANGDAVSADALSNQRDFRFMQPDDTQPYIDNSGTDAFYSVTPFDMSYFGDARDQ